MFTDADGSEYNVVIKHIAGWNFAKGVTIIVTDYNWNFSINGDYTQEIRKVVLAPQKGQMYRLGEGWYNV